MIFDLYSISTFQYTEGQFQNDEAQAHTWAGLTRIRCPENSTCLRQKIYIGRRPRAVWLCKVSVLITDDQGVWVSHDETWTVQKKLKIN
jgi:hypothetical protein